MKIPCLNKRHDFDAVKRAGRKFVSKAFVMQGLSQNTQDAYQFGLIVTKKNGKAVQRNLIKRRFRAVIQENMKAHQIPPLKFVIIARVGCINLSFEDLQLAFAEAFDFFNKKTR